MKIETGKLYHIKNSFFDKVNDNLLMRNKENGNQRPTYFTIREDEILWFIPLSSKIKKYEKIIEQKIIKTGKCDSILIREIGGQKSAILIQNAFPTIEKYIDHEHTINEKPLLVNTKVKTEVLNSFKLLMRLKEKGLYRFFADIDKIKEIMLKEYNENEVL